MTSSETVIKGNVQMDALSQLRVLQLYDYLTHRGNEWKQMEWMKKLPRSLTMISNNNMWKSAIANMT